MTDSRSGLALDELSAEIRPQDDLFRHVNGAWLDRTEIPEDKARWGSFHLIAEQAEKDVRAIVEETRDAEPGSESRKIGDLYTSFMDTERINELGASPILDQLARVDAIHSIPALLRTLGELERDGIGGLIGLYVEPDPGGKLDGPALARSTDERLSHINVEYQAKRESERLAPIEARGLAPETGEAYKQHCVKQGQREGQFKMVSLDYRRKFSFDLDAHVP